MVVRTNDDPVPAAGRLRWGARRCGGSAGAYAFCGGGFPLYVNGEFRGAAIISGLPHLKDHALLCETVKAYWESKKK